MKLIPFLLSCTLNIRCKRVSVHGQGDDPLQNLSREFHQDFALLYCTGLQLHSVQSLLDILNCRMLQQRLSIVLYYVLYNQTTLQQLHKMFSYGTCKETCELYEQILSCFLLFSHVHISAITSYRWVINQINPHIPLYGQTM